MVQPARQRPVIVVGAGPAGLATSHELLARGIGHVVLERGAVGESWRRYYDDLVLHTGRHLSSLPGVPFPRSEPMFVPRARFVGYLEAYASAGHLPVREHVEVRAARRMDRHWSLDTTAGEETAQIVVVATGIASSPVIPDIPGRADFGGGVRHSVDYHRPEAFEGRRVLVVGAGNSGSEIAAELGTAGVDTQIAIRSGVVVIPRDVLGIPSQYLGYALRRLPRVIAAPIVSTVTAARARRLPRSLPRSDESPLDTIPLIGMHLPDAIRAGRVRVRPAIVAFTPTGVRFADGTEDRFDEVILATGFRAAIEFLDGLVRRDQRGFAERTGRVASAQQPGLLFVGHEYDATGGLANVRHDAPEAARVAADWLGTGR